MPILSIAGLAVTAAAIAVLLKQYKPEYAMLAGLAAGVLLFLFVIVRAQPAFSQLFSMLDGAGVTKEYSKVLVKALGVCLVTQLASDVCRDAGETAIASKVELAGKFAVLLLSLPIFTQIVQLATGLIG